MKRIMSLVLVLALVGSLFAGCGGESGEQAEAAAAVKESAGEVTVETAEVTAESTTEATTEATLSAEEILLASLPERMREGYEKGFVELDVLEDLERGLTVGEAAKILQAAYVSRCGVESRTLKDLMGNETYSTREANAWWMSGAIALADMELIYGDRYEDYEQWWNLCKSELVTERFWNNFCWLNYSMDYNTPLSLCDNCAAATKGDMLYAACNFWHGSLCTYKVYDQTNGLETVEFENASEESLLAQASVEEVVEFALRFANSATPVPNPEWVAAADAAGYDTAIITPELLAKETDLPAASCTELPEQWHGIVMTGLCDAELSDLGGEKKTRKIYEYEIQAIKEAGFNFIGLEVNFSWLQGYDYSVLTYYDFDGDGRLDENRLKALDQILAWCVERDIHVDIRAGGLAGCVSLRDHENRGRKSSGAEEFAAVWQALARRYEDIPNEYLSFTVLSEDYGNTELVKTAVEAIRTESADRCIMVEASNQNVDAKTLAEMGVALSYSFGAAHSKLFDIWDDFLRNESSVAGFVWPYYGLDAKALMDIDVYGRGPSANEAMAIAQEYGVGFMLSDFGISGSVWKSPTELVTVRFPDGEYQKMIMDIITVMEEAGCGWCFGHWYGHYGLSFGYPIIEGATYAQIGNYPCYVDQTILGWFKEINGVK